MTKSVLYILLPISIIAALLLASQGVIQNFDPYANSSLLQTHSNTDEQSISNQMLPMGPVASQEAIKEFGTNGGGFFNANSAHPFENPNPLTNFVEILLILLILFLLLTHSTLHRQYQAGVGFIYNDNDAVHNIPRSDVLV